MLLFADDLNIDGRFPRDWRPADRFLKHCPPYLSVAAYCRAERCVRLLLCHGADPTAADQIHRPVASYAVAANSPPCDSSSIRACRIDLVVPKPF
jgi:hypothetical protein